MTNILDSIHIYKYHDIYCMWQAVISTHPFKVKSHMSTEMRQVDFIEKKQKTRNIKQKIYAESVTEGH